VLGVCQVNRKIVASNECMDEYFAIRAFFSHDDDGCRVVVVVSEIFVLKFDGFDSFCDGF
jgi:hypothetical protein